MLIAVAAVLLFLVVKPSWLVKKDLKHTAVEGYITQQFAVTGVNCNNGSNIEVKKGKTFTCTASGGKSFTVTMTNDDGGYQVSEG